jgi:PAS domain S-box-containing protein
MISQNKKDTQEETTSDESLPRNFILQSESGLLNGLLEQNTNALVVFLGTDLVVHYINDHALKLLQLSRESTLQKPIAYVSKQLSDYLLDPATEVFSTGKPYLIKALQYIPSADRTEPSIYCDVELRPFGLDEKSVVGMIAIISNASVQRISESEFRNAELQLRQQLSLITNAMPVSIAYFDSHCNFCFVNKMFETLIGKENTFIEGKHLSEIFGPKIHALLHPYIEDTFSGTLSEFKIDLLVNKKRLNIEGHFLPHLTGSKVIGFYAILIDISSRKIITSAPTHVNISENISSLSISLNELGKTLEQIKTRLNVVKAKIKRVGEQNEQGRQILKQWTSDLKLTEAITSRIRESMEKWLNNRAA